MSISNLEKLNINNSTQWVLVRGKNSDSPLLIHVQAGPGFPMIAEANAMEKNLHLENDFIVAYWDQRGCGLSYNKSIPAETITFDQMRDDLIECTKQLLKKYNKSKAVLVGYSLGATLSVLAGAKDSSLFSSMVVTGIDVDIPYANEFALDFAMSKALAKADKKLMKEITELRQHPVVDTKRFQQRAKILTNLGGINSKATFNSLALSTVGNMLFSKHYGISGLVRAVKGISFSQNSLLPEFNSFNLFKKVTEISVPVHFVQGSLDAIAPLTKGKEYYEQLQTENKSFTVFENSAHMPHYEEPLKFSQLIKSTVKDSSILTSAK
ncbi:putative aminopeptidase YbaC [Cytophagales bacterium WSM2-2]|nr:putative aminopeptidase YbaC [Cytophagales bacterium WSM2-2]